MQIIPRIFEFAVRRIGRRRYALLPAVLLPALLASPAVGALQSTPTPTSTLEPTPTQYYPTVVPTRTPTPDPGATATPKPLPSSLPASPAGVNRRFGIVDAHLNAGAATEAGAGWDRIIIHWDVVQPGSSNDWKPPNIPDPYIEAELAAGREVVAVLIGTPPWATESGSTKAVPTGLEMGFNNQANAWGQFVSRIVGQYRGRIDHWVIWHEPDVWDTSSGANTWLGSDEEYAQLLKVGYLAAKDANPDAVVHLAGLTYYWDANHGREQYLSRLLDILSRDPEAASHDYYFDVVEYHLYYRPGEIHRVVSDAREALDSHGLSRPVWISQINAPPSEDPDDPPNGDALYSVTLEEQASFLLQAFGLGLAAGAERFAFDRMRQLPGHPESVEPYGLLRPDDTRRPVFEAFRVAARHFADVRSARLETVDGVSVVTMDRGEKTTTLVWNDDVEDKRFRMKAIAPEAILADGSGREETVKASGGYYTLELPGAVCSNGEDCFIGGPPQILVEEGEAATRGGLSPAPTQTPAPTLTPTRTPLPVAEPPTPLPPTPTFTPVPISPVPDEAVAATAAPPQGEGTPAAPTAPPLPTPPPVTLLTVLTPPRCITMLVVGMIIFTLAYALQVWLWWKRNPD